MSLGDSSDSGMSIFRVRSVRARIIHPHCGLYSSVDDRYVYAELQKVQFPITVLYDALLDCLFNGNVESLIHLRSSTSKAQLLGSDERQGVHVYGELLPYSFNYDIRYLCQRNVRYISAAVRTVVHVRISGLVVLSRASRF